MHDIIVHDARIERVPGCIGRKPNLQPALERATATVALSHAQPALEQIKKVLTKHYGTRGSQVIPQPSTNRAQPRLTSEF